VRRRRTGYERRGSPRFELPDGQVGAELGVAGLGPTRAIVRDISLGGVKLDLPERIPDATGAGICVVRFIDRDNHVRPPTARGTIRRVSEHDGRYHVSIEFAQPLESVGNTQVIGDMIQRRAYRRATASREIEIRPLDISTGPAPWEHPAREPATTAPRTNVGRLIDIGCGGMGAMFDRPVERGMACEVRIRGTRGKIQAERGRICTLDRGAEGNRVGIAFDDPVVALGDVERRGPTLTGDHETRPLALVVDDEPDVRSTLDRFLTRRGLRVMPAGDAYQALAAIEFESPLLMLLDLKMPEVTGIQLLERLQDRGLSVPHIWAMSAYASDEDAMLSLELGASAFLDKPFDLDHLDSSLQALAAAPAG